MSFLKPAMSAVELSDAGQLVAAERSDRLAGAGEAVAHQLAGALDRRVQRWLRVLALGQLARRLELDRRARQRMREHVVQLARDPVALGDRRRARLLLAGVLELCEEQLRPVLARP